MTPRPTRIAVLCSFNLDLLQRPLKESLAAAGLDAQLHFTGYGLWETEAIDRQSALHQFTPEVVIVFVDAADLLPPLEAANVLPRSADDTKRVEIAWTRVAQVVQALSDRAGERSAVFVHNFARSGANTLGTLEGNSGYSAAASIEELNQRLRVLADTNQRVKVVDFAGLVLRHGQRTLFDDRLWHLGRMRLSRTGLDHLAALYARYLSVLLLPRRKCLVLDLDNTLWGGVLGEDGVDGIAIGQEGIGLAYREFQLALKALSQRGVLLAIASKNNPSDVFEVIDRHPEMVLRRTDFACMEIHWHPKSESLARIAQQLNIGLDSLVFWDDEPREREVVRSQHSTVLVPEVPADPSAYAQAVLALECFDVLQLTEEDRRRGEMYREEHDRQQWLSAAEPGDLADFYRSLNMAMTIDQPDAFAVARFAQLTQRTNQFNFTTRRYSEGELRAKMADPCWGLYVVGLEDRFGKLGVIGAAIVHRKGSDWQLDSFLMSCRALGRGAEEAFLALLTADAVKAGAILHGEFLPTKKNDPARQFLRRLELEPPHAETVPFRFRIDPNRLAVPSWIRIVERSQVC